MLCAGSRIKYNTEASLTPSIMKSCCSSKPCAIIGKVMMILLTLTEIAAIIAVYKTHFGTGGASFGATTSSLSIVALAINTAVWTKYGQMHCEGNCGKNE